MSAWYKWLTVVSRLLIGCCALGCRAGGGPATETAAPSAFAAAPLRQGPLTDFVPAPTLRWLISAEPARLLEHPGALEALAPLVGDAAWQRFAERNGFELGATRSALAAGFDFGTLYLIGEENPADGATIERRFRERLLRGEVVEQPHPDLTRVSGVVGETPQSLLHAQGQLVAWATGDVTLVRLVEGFLLGRFRKTPTALSGAALRAHADFARDAHVRYWAPGPLDPSSWPALSPGALDDATAALGAASLFSPKSCPCRSGDASSPAVRLQFALAGPWEPQQASASPLAAAWQALASSALGELLHLQTPLREPELAVHPTEGGCRLELTVEYALAPLVGGLRDVVAGELEELFPAVSESAAQPPLSGSPLGPYTPD